MPLRPLTLAIALAFGVVVLPAPAAPAKATATQSSKAQRLNAMYDQYWEELLKLNPLQATFQG